ncbi:MAG: YajD family HNH nuclease [Desulfuromonadales bacterium]
MRRNFSAKKGRPVKKKSQEELDEMVRRMKAGQQAPTNYREHSLRLHGWVCAKCGQDFELENLHLLTVHHRDGNHHNNPSDGSNWENLCVYCHDDEHSRSLLGDYLEGENDSHNN